MDGEISWEKSFIEVSLITISQYILEIYERSIFQSSETFINNPIKTGAWYIDREVRWVDVWFQYQEISAMKSVHVILELMLIICFRIFLNLFCVWLWKFSWKSEYAVFLYDIFICL